MESNELKKTDLLAIERTKLANERTFLAYFRTFIVLVSSGFVILRIESLQELNPLGYVFIGIALLLLTIGVARFLYVKKNISKHYFSK